MKRIHLLSTAALGLALLAAPALAQRQGTGDDVRSSAAAPHNRGAAEADRMRHSDGDGASGGPAELLRRAQLALRGGQTKHATELLERAETRLLTGVEPTRPAGGDPAFHVSEARRALMNRDRAEAMRHTNMAIATARDFDGMAMTGSDAGGIRAAGGGGPGAVDSGMGTLPRTGGAVVRDAGTSATSVSRAEGVVLAQTGSRGGTGGSALPPGDSIPGWSGMRGGAQSQPGGGATAPQSGTPGQSPLLPDSFSRGGTSSLDFSSPLSGPGASGITGGSPARVGGAPPSDTSRAPGSSGIGPSGPAGLGVAGPGSLR